MLIESIRPDDNVRNQYHAVVDGMAITLAIREGENPEEVLRAAFSGELTYRDARAAEYPPVAEQLDMLYKDLASGSTTWIDAIGAIKAKHPKPGR